MHPVLFEIPLFGGITIYTYGVLVALGFLVGILCIVYETKRLHLNTAMALDLVFYLIVAAIIGSRLFYIIVTDPSRLISEPWSIFMVWEGGLVFFGGLIAAVTVAALYLRAKKLPVLLYWDAFTPAISIGHAFGRIGCFMAGCCYGSVASPAWYTIVFPDNPQTLAPPHLHLYPTQLIESAGEFLIFVVLMLFRKHKRFDGQVLALYLILYSILRFFDEMLRGDVDRGYIIPNVISSSQGVSLALFAMGVTLVVWGYVKLRRGNA